MNTLPLPNFDNGPLRPGFNVWRRKVQASIGMFPGRHTLGWTPEGGTDADQEEIELQELESPKPGTYKLLVELNQGGQLVWGGSECVYKAPVRPGSAPTDLRDPTRVYSNLIETLEQKLGRVERRNDELEAKLSAKDSAIDELRAKVREMENELAESKESLIDEESAQLLLEVLDRYLNTQEYRDLLLRLVDAAGSDNLVRRRLLARVPDLLAAIGDVLGDQGEQGSAEVN